ECDGAKAGCDDAGEHARARARVCNGNGVLADDGTPSEADTAPGDVANDTDGATSEPYATLDAACADDIPAMCAFYVRCGGAYSQSSCETWFRDKLHIPVPPCAVDSFAAIKNGRALFDAKRAHACHDALRSSA